MVCDTEGKDVREFAFHIIAGREHNWESKPSRPCYYSLFKSTVVSLLLVSLPVRPLLAPFHQTTLVKVTSSRTAKSIDQFLVAILVQHHLTPSSSLHFNGVSCMSVKDPLVSLPHSHSSSGLCEPVLIFLLPSLAFMPSSLRPSSETVHKQLTWEICSLPCSTPILPTSLLGSLMGFKILMS